MQNTENRARSSQAMFFLQTVLTLFPIKKRNSEITPIDNVRNLQDMAQCFSETLMHLQLLNQLLMVRIPHSCGTLLQMRIPPCGIQSQLNAMVTVTSF